VQGGCAEEDERGAGEDGGELGEEDVGALHARGKETDPDATFEVVVVDSRPLNEGEP
jgi:hypothetical protein